MWLLFSPHQCTKWAVSDKLKLIITKRYIHTAIIIFALRFCILMSLQESDSQLNTIVKQSISPISPGIWCSTTSSSETQKQTVMSAPSGEIISTPTPPSPRRTKRKWSQDTSAVSSPAPSGNDRSGMMAIFMSNWLKHLMLCFTDVWKTWCILWIFDFQNLLERIHYVTTVNYTLFISDYKPPRTNQPTSDVSNTAVTPGSQRPMADENKCKFLKQQKCQGKIWDHITVNYGWCKIWSEFKRENIDEESISPNLFWSSRNSCSVKSLLFFSRVYARMHKNLYISMDPCPSGY